jgi:hypothetical protein
MDIIELNEAFAAQSLGCTRALGLADDDPRINRFGRRHCHWPSAWHERGTNCHHGLSSIAAGKSFKGALHNVHWSRAGDCSGDRKGVARK